jgi:hypothetical protein
MGRPERRARAALGLWGLGSVVVSASLLGFHEAPLPRPTGADAPRTATALGALRDDGARWLAVHVLYGECGCSARVAETLVARAPLADVREHVLLIGRDAALRAKLEARGYGVDELDEVEAESRFGLRAAPMLLVLDPDDTLRWSGGYTDAKRGPSIQDVAIIRGALAGAPLPEKPVFGCATAAALRARLDPLGLK